MPHDWDAFLFTDGFATWGDTRPAALLKSVNEAGKHRHISHLYAYTEQGQRVDMDILDLLTHETRGAIYTFSGFELTSESKQTPTHQIMRAHRMRNWRITNTYAQGAEDIFMANSGFYTFANQQVHFVGRGRPEKEIVVILKSGDEVREIAVTMPATILETDLAPRIYAEAAVRKLEDSPDQHETLTLAYATHFRIPRQTVSLLMLESQQDYDRFNINNTTNFEEYVKQHYVAHVIAELTPPDILAETAPNSAYEVPPLPANQLDVISQMSHNFTICKIPNAYLPNLNLDFFSYRKPIPHQSLQLKEHTVMHKISLGYSYYLNNPIREQIMNNTKQLRLQKRPQASLRVLSSIMEYPGVTLEDRLTLSRQLINEGYGNEGYFLLSMTPGIFSHNGTFDLLIESVELQDEPEYAQALREMAKLDSIFAKQALEP